VNVVEATAGDMIPIYFYVKAKAHQTRTLKLRVYRKSCNKDGSTTRVVEAEWNVAFANEKYGRASRGIGKKRSRPSSPSTTIAVPVTRWNVAYFSSSVTGKLRICDEHKANTSKWYRRRWVASEERINGSNYHDIEICVVPDETSGR